MEDTNCHYCLPGRKRRGHYHATFIDGMTEVGCLEEPAGVYRKYYNSYSTGTRHTGGSDDGGIILKDIWMEV